MHTAAMRGENTRLTIPKGHTMGAARRAIRSWNNHRPRSLRTALGESITAA